MEMKFIYQMLQACEKGKSSRVVWEDLCVCVCVCVPVCVSEGRRGMRGTLLGTVTGESQREREDREVWALCMLSTSKSRGLCL